MTFHDHLKMMKRHWLMAIIIVLIVAISAVTLAHFKNNKPYETTIFVSIGGSEINNSIFDEVQAADYFSETVQGWFKNPQFINQINTKSGMTNAISARKQEKQNILITFTTATPEEATNLSKIVKDELEGKLQNYNQKTNSRFVDALFDVNTEKKPLSLPLFLMIGIIGGIILASFALYGYEYLFMEK